MSNAYNADSIKILEGLDAVRMRPGMYIGSTSSRGLHHILWEIVDNSIDEAANGFADEILITLFPDNSVSVEDNGRGMPIDIHPQLGISGVEVIFTQLHAGGKFDTNSYSYSGGLHGVGASVVNALSEWLKVEVCRDYKKYEIAFESKYNTETHKVESGQLVSPLRESGKSNKKSGSLVHFKPDKTVFDSIVMQYDLIAKRAKELAFLNKGLTIKIDDRRSGKSCEYKFDGGIVDFTKYLNQDKNTLFDKPIFIEGEKDNIYIQLAMQYTDGYTESLYSYVNNIPTSEGGMHEAGFKTALTKTLNEYARKNEIIKEKQSGFNGEDFREGMTAVLSVRMNNVQFEGQTKTKLGNIEARICTEAIVSEKLTLFLDDYKNDSAAKAIIGKAVEAMRVREAARKAKDVARKRNSLEGAPLVGKLSNCTGRNPKENELFIVEGDSAGGSAKQGRERRFQAILPLRGKPLNAEKKSIEQVLSNEEIRTIISALGTDIGEYFDISNLKYDKVIIMADADQDGAHIRAILLTFFYRYMRQLITEGHVYMALSPLYKVEKKGEVIYCYDDNELAAATEKLGRGYTLQRYKGLGEMNPPVLWDTTMDPNTRTLVRVTIEDAADAEHIVTILMGDKAEPRKRYIIENADFNKVDTLMDKKGVNYGEKE